MIDLNYMNEIAGEVEILLSSEQLQQLDLYADLLVEWNKKVNLTAILEPGEIAIKHFLDSLLLLKYAAPQEGASLIDVGTGAGFPSVPCGIARPDLKLTLLDSLNKRILFLQELTSSLGIAADCIHARAEEGGQLPKLREQFDHATARAVAHLRELSEYCLPFVKAGGLFTALKGGEIQQELEEAKPAIKLLGGQIEEVHSYTLPDGSGRTAVCIRKRSQTPTKYPRPSGKIKKQPLQ